MIKILNYINGEFVAPETNNYLDVYNPATGEVYARVADSGKADIQRAVEASEKAFPAWKKMPVSERADILFKVASQISDQLNSLSLAETNDTGKPLWLSRSVDIPRAAANFKFYASAIMHFASEAHPMESNAINYTLRQPLGVVGCIAPWNLPLYLFTWKIAPALAAGNCVIAKPSEMTPVSAWMLAQICADAGLPPGVLNIVHGAGSTAGDAIISHPKVKAVSFTGGTKTGQHIAQKTATHFKKLSLELGGKNPTIIFDDCDYEDALTTTLKSAFSNQGEICLCGSRIYVQSTIYDQFKSDFAELIESLIVGDPLAEGTLQGAVISAAHLEKIKHYVALAIKEGGAVLTGGKQVQLSGRCQKGWFYAPTLIEGLPTQCRVNQEEIFGPVVTIMPFEDEQDVLQKANATKYGLAANMWTSELARAHRMAEMLDFGIVWVNCWMLRDLRTPFGGVKNSGMGREGGWEALRFFTEPKNVCIKY
jgi:aminomuconate-semialdehyde/2-hydroxymuconate-6-semialdehyde dehydrogenase